MTNPTCQHRAFLPADYESDTDIGTGPECGKPARWLSCTPIIDQPVCEEHRCRCGRLIPVDASEPTDPPLATIPDGVRPATADGGGSVASGAYGNAERLGLSARDPRAKWLDAGMCGDAFACWRCEETIDHVGDHRNGLNSWNVARQAEFQEKWGATSDVSEAAEPGRRISLPDVTDRGLTTSSVASGTTIRFVSVSGPREYPLIKRYFFGEDGRRMSRVVGWAVNEEWGDKIVDALQAAEERER